MTDTQMKMLDNQHRNVAVSWQDDGEFYLIRLAGTSKASTDTQNSVLMYKRIKLVQRTACFQVNLLLGEDSTVLVKIFLFHLL